MFYIISYFAANSTRYLVGPDNTPNDQIPIGHWDLDINLTLVIGNWTLPDLPAGRQEGWLPLLDKFPARGGQAQLAL